MKLVTRSEDADIIEFDDFHMDMRIEAIRLIEKARPSEIPRVLAVLRALVQPAEAARSSAASSASMSST